VSRSSQSVQAATDDAPQTWKAIRSFGLLTRNKDALRTVSYYEPICLLTNDQLTGQTAARYIPSPSAAAAGLLNLTNYIAVRLSGILLVCSQTEILYKLTFSLRLHSDPERQISH
jgi:hypothetical protein